MRTERACRAERPPTVPDPLPFACDRGVGFGVGKAHRSQVMQEAAALEKRPVVCAAPDFCCICTARRSETGAAANASAGGIIRKACIGKRSTRRMGRGRASDVWDKRISKRLVRRHARWISEPRSYPGPPCAPAGYRIRVLWLGKRTQCPRPPGHVARTRNSRTSPLSCINPLPFLGAAAGS